MAMTGLAPGLARQRIFCLAAPGLEYCLQRELQGLHIPGRMETVGGGVLIDGCNESLWRSVLQSRIAESVRLRIGDPFHAPDKKSLKERLKHLPWEDVFRHGPCVKADTNWRDEQDRCGGDFEMPEVKASSNKSRLYHTGLVEDCVLEVLHNRRDLLLNENGIERENTVAPRRRTPPIVNVHLQHDGCQVSVSASGQLYQRGYRKAVGEAPLRETLAAACVQEASPLRRLTVASHTDEELVLWDPFCGSGVLLLEALGISMGQPPGHPLKNHPFKSFACHDSGAYDRVVHGLEIAEHPALAQFSLLGTDHDSNQIEKARRNFDRFRRRLWTHQDLPDNISPVLPCKVDFNVGSLAQVARSLHGRPTMILTNAPYGVLSGARTSASGSGWSEAIEAYTQLGRMLRRHDIDWRGVFCLVANVELFKEHTGLEWISKLRFVSGSRWVDLLEWTGQRSVQRSARGNRRDNHAGNSSGRR